jgi:transcriptional regulator with XRE-family HTH domain
VTPAQKLVITALAERSGLHQSRLERKAENPSIATLQRLARGLRVQDLLRGGPGDPAP